MLLVLPTKLATLLAAFYVVCQLGNADSITETKTRLLKTNDIDHANFHSSSSSTKSNARLSPVILLPGDGGSRLRAKLDRNNVTHHYCERKSKDWFDLWLNLSLLVPFALDCWIDNMKLVYNSTTRKTSNMPGVEIEVGSFGECESVEYVDTAKVKGSSYFDALVRQLVSLGYERNKNIFGAPYDFRRAPNELGEFFRNLKTLVEAAYKENGNESVVLVCHSMGCLHSLYFLNHNTQEWKDKYIRSMITLAGVWGGAVKAIKAIASGDNFGVLVIPSLSLRKDVRTFPSIAYLLPSSEVWPDDQILVKNSAKNYTVKDYKQLFKDIHYPVGHEIWLDVHNLSSPNRPPNVEVHCLHGDKVTTIEKLDYGTGEFPDSKPKITYGDGDGTVNLISLQACVSWSAMQKQTVHHRNFSSIDHMTILSDEKVMDYIGEALAKKS